MKKLTTLLILIISFASINMNAQEDAFIIDYPAGILSSIDLSDGATNSAGTALASMGGMEFGPNNVLYGMNSSSNQLFEIDTADATATLIGSSSIPSTHIWTGLAYDIATGIMYGMAAHGTATGSANLYTIDLTDGTSTLLGSQGIATAIGCIAIDENGQMYGLQEDANAKIYIIDKTDGSVTLVGPVNSFGGAGMGYGMDYNLTDQTMYLTAYDSFTFNNDLYTVDLTDGSVTQVASLVVWTSALAIINHFNCDFSADVSNICSGTTVNYTNESTGADSYAWVFEGGTPATSTDENPSVVYSAGGVYDAELTITNATGSTKTETKTDYITVLETPVKANTPTGDDGVCTASYYSYTVDEVLYAENYEWELSPADAGTLTPNMLTASLETADDWTGDFTIRVRATNMCGDGDWSDNLEGTLSQSPDEFALGGGGIYCLGADGVELTLDGSQTDVDYELYLDGVSTGNIVAGTGSALSFGLVTDEGYYEAVGFNDNCTYNMQNQILVEVAYPPLEPAAPVGPESICDEATADYMSSGSDNADSYVWEISPEDAGVITGVGLEATVTWNSEFLGTAMITLYGMNDCGAGNPSTALEISVGAPNPEVTGEEMVCDFSSESYEVANNDGSSYTWIVTGGIIADGQGTNMITVDWNGEGNGTVTLEEETTGGCTGSSDEFAVVIDDCTGIGEGDLLNSISISPNPAKTSLVINGETQISNLSIYSLSGQKVFESNEVGNKQSIDVSKLESGLYFVRIHTNIGVVSKKLIIK